MARAGKWTIEALRQHLLELRTTDLRSMDRRFASQQEAVRVAQAAADAARLALSEKEVAQTKSLDRFATTESVDAKIAGMLRQVEGLRTFFISVTTTLVGVILLAIAVAGFVLHL